MAITFVNSATANVVNGGTVSLNVTGLSAQNDIILAFFASTGGTQATPSGYTAIHDFTNTGSGPCIANLSYKIQTASPDTTISGWDTGTNANSGAAIAYIFRGVDTTTPQDVATVETPDNITPAAITPTNNNCAIVVFAAAGVLDTALGTRTNFLPDPSTVANGDDDNDVTVGGNYRILSGGGGAPQDPGAWGAWAGTGTVQKVAYTLALRPAAEGQPAAKRMGGIRFGGDYRSGGPGRSLWRTGLILPWRTRLAYG